MVNYKRLIKKGIKAKSTEEPASDLVKMEKYSIVLHFTISTMIFIFYLSIIFYNLVWDTFGFPMT